MSRGHALIRPAGAIAWELKRRGQQNVRRESCETILRYFPDRDEAVVAWVTIASGKPYKRSSV